jgi:hypothetical protein
MQGRKIVRTNLGDLIVAVTDEVGRFIQDPSGVNLVVACIVSDVLPRRDVRVGKRLRQIIALAKKNN